MNQPSCSLSLDLDTCSNSSDSLSECETLTVPDPNDPVTVQKFVEETVVGPISLQKQNVDRISAINSQLHIGDVHKNFFHFHGNIKPPTKEETQENGGNEPNSHHSSDNVAPSSTRKKTKSLFRYKSVILSIIFLAFVLVVLVACITVGFNKASTREDEKEQTTEPSGYSTQTSEYTETTSEYTEPPSSLLIIGRDLWQALDPLEPLSENDPALLVVIKHTGGANCMDFQTCSARIREIQKEDMKQYPDIRYNFLIGGDARIYEGRGWLVQNEGIRNDSVDFAFIGNFSTDIPNEQMLLRTRSLVIRGAFQDKINYKSYHEVAHNHTEPTDSPGENLYKLLSQYFNHLSFDVCYDVVDGKVEITETCPPPKVNTN